MMSNLPQGWEEKRLSEVCENVSITHKFKKEDKVVFVNTGDVLEGKFLHKDFKRIKDLPGQAKKLIQKNDILFSEIRPKNKRYAFVEKNLNEYVVSTKFMVIRNFKNIIPTYLYLFLTSENILEVCQTIAESRSGTFPQITFDSIKYEKILIPQDINEQKRIADILSAFDDKIELNNQMNQTLEDMATTLFKEWFENFNFPNDEGKAYKENGGEFKSSELGEIPVDWEVKCLKDISNIVMGQSPKGKSYNTENIGFPLINGASDFEGTLPKPKKHTTEPTKISEDNDIVFGIRATIGNVVFIKKGYCLGRGVSAVRVDEDLLEFTFLLLQKEIINLAQLATGSVFANLTKNDLEKLKIVFPPNDILVRFSKQIKPLLEQIKLNNQQSQTLKKQRDTLLPKLMSGEIRV